MHHPGGCASAAPLPAIALTTIVRPLANIVSSAYYLGSRISCGSATTCLTVGANFNSTSGNPAPVAQALKGKTWKSVPVKVPKGRRPR